MSNPAGYSKTQIIIHWGIALLILSMLISGEAMGDFERVLRRNPEAAQPIGVYAHIFSGVAILALTLWRLFLRFTRGVPAAPEGGDKRLELLAKLVHLSLYVVMILGPVSGLAAWFGNVRIAGELHELIEPLLIGSLSLHVIGALYHQYYLKDRLLRRMMKSG